MKIIAKDVVGVVFVVAEDEAGALTEYDRDGFGVFTAESDAVDHERYRNSYSRPESGELLNTYRIEIRAVKVH